MDKLKPEELTEAIRQGINKSRNDFAKSLFIAIVVMFVFFILFVGFSKYQDYKFKKLHPEIQTAILVNCDKPYIDCYAIDKDIEDRMETNQTTGGGVLPVQASGRFCGYQEALAWFNIYQQKIKDKLYLNCDV